jgi:hypothetical protein
MSVCDGEAGSRLPGDNRIPRPPIKREVKSIQANEAVNQNIAAII